jgi:hypothetical protein
VIKAKQAPAKVVWLYRSQALKVLGRFTGRLTGQFVGQIQSILAVGIVLRLWIEKM